VCVLGVRVWVCGFASVGHTLLCAAGVGVGSSGMLLVQGLSVLFCQQPAALCVCTVVWGVAVCASPLLELMPVRVCVCFGGTGEYRHVPRFVLTE
jgi:hypothetical protein